MPVLIHQLSTAPSLDILKYFISRALGLRNPICIWLISLINVALIDFHFWGPGPFHFVYQNLAKKPNQFQASITLSYNSKRKTSQFNCRQFLARFHSEISSSCCILLMPHVWTHMCSTFATPNLWDTFVSGLWVDDLSRFFFSELKGGA